MKQTFKNRIILLVALFVTLLAPLGASTARAAGATLDLTSADASIYYGAGSSTELTATLRLDDQPLQGAQVRLALVSGAGTLSAAEATTDASGQARISFTAPATLEAGRVVVVQASYTTPDQTTASASTTIFLGSASEFMALTTVETGAGKQLIRPARMNIDLLKRGAGTPIVGVGNFERDPYQTICKAEPGPPELGPALSCTRGAAVSFKPDSAFYMVHLSSTQDVGGLEVRLRYRGDRNERSKRLFWHDASGWRPVRGATVATDTNELRFTFTASSTPSLSQLASGQFGLVVGH